MKLKRGCCDRNRSCTAHFVPLENSEGKRFSSDCQTGLYRTLKFWGTRHDIDNSYAPNQKLVFRHRLHQSLSVFCARRSEPPFHTRWTTFRACRLSLQPLLPLFFQSGTCTLREAIIISSVLAKTSIPEQHSSAAMFSIAGMEYNGANSIFLRTLLNKKYTLPLPVLDVVVQHFQRSAFPFPFCPGSHAEWIVQTALFWLAQTDGSQMGLVSHRPEVRRWFPCSHLLNP